MPAIHHVLDHRPGADVGGEHGQTQVGAGREVRALVVDHQRLVILRHDLDGLGHDLEHLGIPGGFYRVEGGRLQYLTVDGSYADVVRGEDVLLLSDVKLKGEALARNGSASLWNLGSWRAASIALLRTSSRL